MTRDEAKQLVYKTINRPSQSWKDKPEFVILDEVTIEKKWGWVFFYQSSDYLKSGDFGDALSGNGPYIVNRHSGEIVGTCTSFPIEEQIKEYEKEHSLTS